MVEKCPQCGSMMELSEKIDGSSKYNVTYSIKSKYWFCTNKQCYYEMPD